MMRLYWVIGNSTCFLRNQAICREQFLLDTHCMGGYKSLIFLNPSLSGSAP